MDSTTTTQAPLRSQIDRTKSVASRRFISDEELAVQLSGAVISPGLILIETKLPFSDRNLATGFELDEYPAIDHTTLFFDLETTGLAGGSGTIAFLAGIGELRDDVITVRQFLITRYEAEARLLLELEDSFHRANTIVSYNGKTFDWPLLQTRRRMQRQPIYKEDSYHLDLLYWIRRAFSNQWSDCRLQTVERELFQLKRHNDIESELIPMVWSEWLRFGRWERFSNVISHHRRDIESLVRISRLIPKIYMIPEEFNADCLSIARYFTKKNRIDSAISILEKQKKLTKNERLFIASSYKRKREWDRAVPIWQELSVSGCVQSCLALALYFEHRCKHYHSALHYALQLQDLEPGKLSHQKRIDRIRSKERSTDSLV